MKKMVLWSILLFLQIVNPAMGQNAPAEKGPADQLWDYYRQGKFELVVSQGKALLSTGNTTAQVNLAVGRALVDLEKYEDAYTYLVRASKMDSEKSWIYAWAQVYLGVLHFKTGYEDRAKQAWILARDCNATKNATREAGGYLTLMGLGDFFGDWSSLESEHFSFRFSGRLIDFDAEAFARKREEGYAVINKWFGGGPGKKIRFLVWASQDEAKEAGIPSLGFCRPEHHLIHSLYNQTVGHEISHVFCYYVLEPENRTGLINEGVAVYLDLTGRDQMQRAKKAFRETDSALPKVSVQALWRDWSLTEPGLSYPLAGAFVKVLIEKGGKDKFLEFFVDQSYENARKIYGADLVGWIEDFEEELFN